jgi:hypothetical protein
VSVPVLDPFGAAGDGDMPSLALALDPVAARRHLERRLPRLAGEEGVVHLRAARVTRYKAGRRCVIEYEVRVRRPDLPPQAATLIGKVRRGRFGGKDYRLLDAIWRAGFVADSEDGLSVAEPLGHVSKLRMSVQRKMAGRPATDVLAAPDGVAVARRIAEAACKLHRAGVPASRRHTMADELRLLRTYLAAAAEAEPRWADRIERLLEACERLGAAAPEPRPHGIHRDLYPDQVLVHGQRVYLIDFDLYAEGDPCLDIGNFLAHVTEQSLRTLGDPGALAELERAMEERFLELSSGATRAGVRAYATLALARLVYLSTRFPDRRPFTGALLSLCEERLGLGR